jgi:ABC-type phosphate transport system substrate-binding protein
MTTICSGFKRGISILAMFVIISGVTTAASAASYEVIVNKNVPSDSLSKVDLRSIFLGEKIKWNNNKYIKIVLPEDGFVFKDFLQSVVGKTPSQFNKHWMNQVFTGKASMPPEVDETKIVDFVASHANCISFVAAGQSGTSVKTISIK